MSEIHITLPAETIAYFGPLPITNTLIVTWLVMAFLIVISLFLKNKIQIRKPGKLQTAVEIILSSLHSLFSSITGKDTVRFFPLLATLFLFILIANWTEIIPGMHTVNLKVLSDGSIKEVSILRSPSTDLNTTLALALISVVALQYYGIKALGLAYFGKFINLRGPVDFFVGLLEIISEFAKIISFSFRLFGNIFAGQVLLIVIAVLIPLIAPLPFLGLELFVGLIQALVFSILTAVFLNLAVVKH